MNQKKLQASSIINRKGIQLFIILGFLVFLCSCGTGYQKVDGEWAWVSYDEGNGKTIKFLEGVDSETFEVLANNKFAKDKNQVYMIGSLMPDIDAKTFEILENNDFAKDKNHAYVDGTPIYFANPKTFKALESPYSKDDQRVFCGNVPMDVKKIDEFEVTQSSSYYTYFSSVPFFVEQNKEYEWLLNHPIENIVFSDLAEAKTSSEKYKGFKLVE